VHYRSRRTGRDRISFAGTSLEGNKLFDSDETVKEKSSLMSGPRIFLA